MSASYFSTTEQERFVSPADWEFSIYSLKPKAFWFSKSILPLFDGCEIVRWDFRGPIRFRAGLKVPKLQINFIDSYSSVASRLQGRGQIDSVVMITTKQNQWDGLTDVGALGIELNFDEETTNKILNFETSEISKHFMTTGRSIVISVSSSAQRLKTLAHRYLSFLDHHPEMANISNAEINVEPMEIDLGTAFLQNSELRKNIIIEMARNVVDEAFSSQISAAEVGSPRRRIIALKIEQMLWKPPFHVDDDFSGTLEEFASLFKVRPRTIQIAIQEQFGVGFVALRRLIRLNQIRKAILQTKGDVKLSTLAAEYKFHFGRLSKEYRELFGKKPSHELIAIRKGFNQLF